MAVIDNFFGLRAAARAEGRLVHLLRRIAGRLIEWNDLRRTRAALERLSAHELDDIGLTSGDIDRLTRR